eukprot:5372830-Amphidinium_carterae.2
MSVSSEYASIVAASTNLHRNERLDWTAILVFTSSRDGSQPQGFQCILEESCTQLVASHQRAAALCIRAQTSWLKRVQIAVESQSSMDWPLLRRIGSEQRSTQMICLPRMFPEKHTFEMTNTSQDKV